MNKKNTYKILALVAIIVPIIFGLSYGYFLANLDSNNLKTNGNNSNTFDANLVTDNNDYISLDNINPITKNEINTKAGKYDFSVVTGKNTNNVSYALSLTDLSISSNLKVSDFKWNLINKDTNKSIANGNFNNVTTSTISLATSLVTSSKKTVNYELQIYLLDKDSNQTSKIDGTFNAKISMLADLIN